MFRRRTLLVTLLSIFAVQSVYANNAGFGGNCSQPAQKLAHGTFQLSTGCTPQFYCAANSTCAHKGCRRADFPFGYKQGARLPPKCSSRQFCPDEEDQCQDLLPVGSLCQLNRDDQCQPPSNARQLAGPRNLNGAICLNFYCMWANVTLGQPCIVENVPYIVYDSTGSHQFINVVSRDNCENGLYCDGTKRVCMKQLDHGAACAADKECSTMNCDTNGACGLDPSTVQHVATWVYVIVGVAIVGAMAGILITLFVLHRRSREAEQEKRAQYWREQEAFRNNILSMREQARASLLSLPLQSGNNGSRGAFRDQDFPGSESQSPIHYGSGSSGGHGKTSALRHTFSDRDNDADSMEEALVHSHSPDDDDDVYGNSSRQRKLGGGRI
ncbi:uncharacterized protein EI90DRAFT_2976586 [Cantharellus anzutake]|uniref:uncharacterized protein n=1 Tax=Cantharellus anzutake TaxID=1750568 RepID=UPI00190861D9|nr:uncharacterized protein EI90DRAFT_2976586 [Cantharellus anzutake]KAF8325226.1 hypothetical protein EI90DRAFT_2976586 [Cantharellus anzutake]